jgi:type IV pilus assembly protein PilY1
MPRTRLSDGSLQSNPSYDPNQPYAKVYKQEQNEKTNFNTLADLAFYYWATDLVAGDNNNRVKPLFREPAVVNGIDPFWNPRNDPSSWQNVVTYTIGYGTAASGWSTSPRLRSVNNVPEAMFDSVDLTKLMAATDPLKWPKHNWGTEHARMEMMHAAINGRGKFYPAVDEQALVNAIRDIIKEVIPVPTNNVTSAQGSSVSSRMDSDGYEASFDSE